MSVRKVPGDADSLFSRLKLWERELVDYAQAKHSTGSANRDLKTTAMPRLTHASLKPGSCSSKSDARTSSSATSSSRSYQAPTLSSFAKTSRPLTGVEYKSSQQYSPPTKDKYAKSPSPVVRKSLIPPSDFESAEESPSNICQELCQVSSRLSGLVRDIHDDRLRSAVSRFCDDIGGYVSQEERRRDADVAASGSEFFMSTSSLHRHVEKLVENAVAPLQRENRELSWKVTRLEEDLRHTEESESAQAKLVAELQACVDQLKAENTRLSEEKAAGWKEVEKELAKLKDDNRRIKDRMQAVVESNRILQETLQKRDNDLHELQSNTRSLIGTLMTCLDNIPPSSSSAPVPVPVNACSSASGLTVTSSIPESVVKVDSGESNSLRIRVVKQQQTAAKEASSVKSVPKSKTKRAPSVKPSSTSIGVASTLTNGTCHSSVGGVEADAESESETELASTDSEFASEFHNNLQQLDDYLRQLRGSLEKRTG